MFTSGRGTVFAGHTLIAYRTVVGAVQFTVTIRGTTVTTRSARLGNTFAHGVDEE